MSRPLLASHTAQGPAPAPQAGSAAISSWNGNRRRPMAFSSTPAAAFSAAAAGDSTGVRLAAAGSIEKKGVPLPRRCRLPLPGTISRKLPA